MLNPTDIRNDFPIFESFAQRGEVFVYLDNAATTQRAGVAIDAENNYYRNVNANVHRSPHKIGMEATELFEEARLSVAKFLGTPDQGEVVFTRGTTESINIVALMLSEQLLKPGDVILTTPSEHHSNLIPWQMAAKRSGARLEFTALMKDGSLDLEEISANWNPKTKVFAFQHASNVTGAIHPAKELCNIARERGALSLVDGAQSAAHVPLNMQDLDCDFFTFSGHKLCGPTGIGVLYGRRSLLEQFDPVFGGGEMILKVTRTSATYNALPFKFEAGTPNIAGAIGLGAAVEYLMKLGMREVEAYLNGLAEYAYEQLSAVKGVTVHGPRSHRTGAMSFSLECNHPHDIASILDAEGISIRAGHHCAQPLMQFLGVPATARASFYIYNTRDEVDLLVLALERTKKALGYVA